MIRKVIRQRDSFTLTLPKSWATQLKLKSGDEVLVEQQEMNLVVSGEMARPEKKRITLDVSNYDRTSIYLLLKSLYENGIYEIKLTFSNEDTKDYKRKVSVKIPKQIQEFVERFEGLAIVSQGRGFYVLRDITLSSQEAFESIQRRIFFLILEFQEEVCTAIKNKDFNYLSNAREINFNISKFVSFCLRLLNHRTTPRFNLYYVINTLDLVVSHTRHLCESLYLAKKVSKSSEKIITDVGNHFRKYYEFYYSPNKARLQELLLTRLQIRENSMKVPTNEAAYIARFAEGVVEQLFSSLTSIIALAPDKIR